MSVEVYELGLKVLVETVAAFAVCVLVIAACTFVVSSTIKLVRWRDDD